MTRTDPLMPPCGPEREPWRAIALCLLPYLMGRISDSLPGCSALVITMVGGALWYLWYFSTEAK